METDALRVLHRVVAEAYINWPGGDANEQACLWNMKTQLYAALMDHHQVPSESCSAFLRLSQRLAADEVPGLLCRV